MHLQAQVHGAAGEITDVLLQWDGCVAIGYAGRDQEGVKKHIDELAAIGVAPPYAVPAMYWVEPERVTTARSITVVGPQTSAEVEFFLAPDAAGRLYVTVASDHTDRSLEAVSVGKSKQICPKIVSPVFWAIDDVIDHWDRLELICTAGSDKTPYQRGDLSALLDAKTLLELAAGDAGGRYRAIALLSGTLPVIGGKFIYADRYAMTLTDPVLGRTIAHEYTVAVVDDRS